MVEVESCFLCRMQERSRGWKLWNAFFLPSNKCDIIKLLCCSNIEMKINVYDKRVAQKYVLHVYPFIRLSPAWFWDSRWIYSVSSDEKTTRFAFRLFAATEPCQGRNDFPSRPARFLRLQLTDSLALV